MSKLTMRLQDGFIQEEVKKLKICGDALNFRLRFKVQETWGS
jgi:hypothetical protein